MGVVRSTSAERSVDGLSPRELVARLHAEYLTTPTGSLRDRFVRRRLFVLEVGLLFREPRVGIGAAGGEEGEELEPVAALVEVEVGY